MMVMDWQISVFVFLFISYADSADIIRAVELKTPSGWVRGYEVQYDNIQKLYRFNRIPFAQPPVGELRFRKPQPIGEWNDTKGSVKESGHECMQAVIEGYEMGIAEMSEDCLYLNIYIPGEISRDSKLSVMVWFHGGGYALGSATQFVPQKLAVEGNVIVVTTNYRLGTLGFLTLHDPLARGNYGLWDQIEALKWIQNNIKSFGGNPDSVTIFGESAGGSAVHLLSMIPSNKGLFHRCISMSGAGNYFLFGTKEHEANFAKTLSEKTNCSAANGALSLLECLRDVPSHNITNALTSFDMVTMDNYTILSGGMVPSVDGELFLVNPVYQFNDETSPSFEFFTSIDFMAGTMNSESSILVVTLPFLADLVKKLDFNVSEGIPKRVLCESLAPAFVDSVAGNFPDLSQKLCDFYTVTDDEDRQSRRIADFYTDYGFLVPTIKFLTLHAKGKSKGSTYQYLFTKPSPVEIFGQMPSWFEGAGHGEEQYLLFNITALNYENRTKEEHDVLSKNVIQYWTNFAKSGNPNGEGLLEWPAYDITDKSFINFNTPITTGANLIPDAVKLVGGILEMGNKNIKHDEL